MRSKHLRLVDGVDVESEGGGEEEEEEEGAAAAGDAAEAAGGGGGLVGFGVVSGDVAAVGGRGAEAAAAPALGEHGVVVGLVAVRRARIHC